MKQFEMNCFEVTEADGGGMSSFHVAYVSTQSLADELVAKQKGYRSAHPYKKLITIFESMDEIAANSKQNLIKTGLAKLTTAEKQAMGLS